MNEEQFETIVRKMDALTKLLAFNIVKDKTVNEQVDILTKTGLRAAEIADVLGKTENQVYVTQNLLRKKKKTAGTPDETPSMVPAEGGATNV